MAIAFKSLQPFSAVASSSMAPSLSLGDLILIKSVDYKEIEVEDIIVFSVPKEYRGRFGYPGVIAHRVIRVENDPTAGTVFWTKGDNTEIDPFGVQVRALKGKYQMKVPFLGYVILFLRSINGLIFLGAIVFLYLLYFLSDRFEERFKNFLSGKPSPELLNHFAKIEGQNTEVHEALTSFARAVSEYGEHLKSHTKLVQNMAEGAKELNEAAKELKEAAKNLAEEKKK